MAKYLTDRQDRKLTETIRKVDSLIRNQPGPNVPIGLFGTPGTDFGTPIVPKTTIPAATRTVVAGSDTFTPGQGEAYLFRVDSAGDLTPWLDSNGEIVSKAIFNFSEESYEPNVPTVTSVSSMAGTAMLTMAGTAFLGMANPGVATDYIGPDTPVHVATMDRTGRLVIPPAATPAQQLRLLRAMISQSDGIGPDEFGEIWLFVDQQVDNTATAGGADTITLAAGSGAQAGFVVRIIAGKGAGQSRWIKSLSGNVATIGTFGDVSHPWDTTRQPDGTSVYKLERLLIRNGHWNHAEGSGRVLYQYEECYVQPITSHGNHYQIIRGADKTLLRATVDESGGMSPNSQGTIILSDSGETTTGLWDWMHADKYIDRFGQIVVQYEKTIPVGGPSIDEGRIYRIMGADCSALTDSPP